MKKLVYLVLILSLILTLYSCGEKKAEIGSPGNDIAFKNFFVNMIMTKDLIKHNIEKNLNAKVGMSEDENLMIILPEDSEDYLSYTLNFKDGKVSSIEVSVSNKIANEVFAKAKEYDGKFIGSEQSPERIEFKDLVFQVEKVGDTGNFYFVITPNYVEEMIDILMHK